MVSSGGKLLYKDFGELLFTHFGVSGPTVLSASCHLKGQGCSLLIDLKPALEESKLDGRILRDLEQYRNRSMENALADLLPRSMIPVILDALGIDPLLQANSLTREKRRELTRLLKAFPVKIRGKRPVSEAIITGRKRAAALWRSAAAGSVPAAMRASMSSMSTMQFLIIMPTKPSAPTMAQKVNANPLMSIAATMPTASSGMQHRMMIGRR